MNCELIEIIDAHLRASDIDGAIVLLEKRLADLQSTRFNSLIGKQFTNSPSAILASINDFIEKADCDIQAVYLEMNGFDNNYDRWYFNLFSYEYSEDDPDDLDWLSDWHSVSDDIVLTGLEAVQADFAWYAEEHDQNDESFDEVFEIATHLVMAKFVALVQAAVASGELVKPIPILSTAHDYDVIGRFEPTV